MTRSTSLQTGRSSPSSTAATPLSLGARSASSWPSAPGVLNLGVEGMMVMGAAAGFAAAIETGSTLVGALGGAGAGAGAVGPVRRCSRSGLAANQVASGLALTILGLGLSGLVGSRLRRAASASRRRISTFRA